MSETRIPVQKRSIEKRDRIIEKGFELMCNNGYFNWCCVYNERMFQAIL